ncbi:MAG: thymidine phosphorylase, partial [Oligoflexia bacterium]|nr:thymidine phosphorylase [Oligoflexia bacterium]
MKSFRLETFAFLILTVFYPLQIVSEDKCKKSFSGQQFNMPLLIEKKVLGQSHSQEEISYIIQGVTNQTIPDYQISAWLMAVRLNGATREETGFLTKAMVESGDILKFNQLSAPIVDKHSTGGVGDKVSLVLAPLCASCDLAVPMISGRGLGHTGGTLDKLESLRGFNIHLSSKEMEKQIQEIGVFIAGPTENLVPADKKLYELRDVTATVNSFPLITSSIMSKKMAEGLDALVMDIKFGSGAVLKTVESARQLAEELKYVAEYNGVKFRGLITNMDQPLGRFIGNELEVREILDILKNNIPVEKEVFYNSVKDLSLQIVAHMLEITGKVKSVEEGLKLAQSKLEDGLAFKTFEKMCLAQGTCSLDLPENLSQQYLVLSPQSGYVSAMKTDDIGRASIFLGAGRQEKEDVIN